MKVVIKTNHNMTIGLWLNLKEVGNLSKIVKDNAFSNSIILDNGMEINITRCIGVVDMRLISNKGRKVFDGEIDIHDLDKQLGY